MKKRRLLMTDLVLQIAAAAAMTALVVASANAQEGREQPARPVGLNTPAALEHKSEKTEKAAPANSKPKEQKTASGGGFLVPSLDRQDVSKAIETIAFFAIVSLAPAAVLMVTAFVRIHVVLTILRQALGNPQIPGNQVVSALALLLTALVMQPVGEKVYEKAVKPYAAKTIGVEEAWNAGSQPIKAFMIDQIFATHHESYLADLYEYVEPSAGERPTDCEDLPMKVVAPAFLLSELTTALVIGFAIYIPFLVIDLVVSSVLAAMGLFMLPPAHVALPLKLIVFVLAGGWRLVSDMLLRGFALGG